MGAQLEGHVALVTGAGSGIGRAGTDLIVDGGMTSDVPRASALRRPRRPEASA